MLKDILIIIAALGFALILIGLLCVVAIWHNVKHAPKAKMFYCPTHGPFTENGTIKFMDSVEIVDKYGPNGEIEKSHIEHGVQYCPMCWTEKWKGAGK